MSGRDWTFNSQSLADTFNDHLHEQLPWIDHCYDLLLHVGRHYLANDSRMYDIGASLGNVTRTFAKEIESRNVKAVSIETSAAMCEQWTGVGELVNADALSYEFEPFDFGVLFLTLMFMPASKQRTFIRQLYGQLNEGGAIFILDKVMIENSYVNTIMHRFTLNQKVCQGADPAKILEKEFQLAGMQRPINPDFVFANIERDKIFQMGNFCGWVLTK